MKLTFIVAGTVVGALLLAGGYVVWLVFGGGPEKWSGERALAGRTYSADTPVSIGAYLDAKVPRGFKADEQKNSLAEHRDPEAVSFELTLGKYLAAGGSRNPAQLYLIVSSAGNESKVLPPQNATWTSRGTRDGLQLFSGALPEEVVATAVDAKGGRRAELRTTNDVYTLDQALTIVSEVVNSISVHHQAMDALFAKAQTTVSSDNEIRSRAFQLIASKLGPIPSAPGVPRRLEEGGFLLRDYQEDTSAHAAIVLGTLAVNGDPEKTARSLKLDTARITPDLSNAVASTGDSFPLPDGSLRVGVLAVWLGTDGALQAMDLQSGTAPHWTRNDYHEAWRVALKECAQPGRLTFLRFANFWDFNHRKFEEIAGWIDASRRMAQWAKDGHPLWVGRT